MSANSFGPAGTDTDWAARQSKQDLRQACQMYSKLWENAQESGHVLDLERVNKNHRILEAELDSMRSLMQMFLNGQLDRCRAAVDEAECLLDKHPVFPAPTTCAGSPMIQARGQVRSSVSSMGDAPAKDVTGVKSVVDLIDLVTEDIAGWVSEVRNSRESLWHTLTASVGSSG